MKIVSLLPAATDIIVALGCSEQLVGRSHECTGSSAITDKPVCTSVHLDATASARLIDAKNNPLDLILSLFTVNYDLLAELKPDLIITQDVCAVSSEDLEHFLEPILGQNAKVLCLSADDLGGVWQDILSVAKILGIPQEGDQLVFRLQQALASIASQTWGESPKVGCIEWPDPLMSTGHWMPELLEMAGVEDHFGKAGQAARYLEWDALISADPDALILMPCGFDLAQTRQTYQELSLKPQWNDLRAVQNGRVYGVNAKFFVRSGPSLVESLQILAEIFHPKSFDFGHKNIHWCCLESF